MCVLTTGALLANSYDAKNNWPQDGRQQLSTFTYFTTTLFIWYFGRIFSVLNFDSLQKADYIFCLDMAVLKIIHCCHTICFGPWEFQGCGLPEAGGGTILGQTVFDVADLCGESTSRASR